tara:strand:+ start:202 stop:564 length:363 start_codon:yes stop_codon:yes gene_type:complete
MNKNFKHIEDFYNMDSDFKDSFKCTPFDFYLDFIGYTTDRNLKKEEEEENKRNPKYRDYENLYKIRNSKTTHKWKFQVFEADQVFGHRERVQFGLALMIFEDVGYEDVYKFIDNLLVEEK